LGGKNVRPSTFFWEEEGKPGREEGALASLIGERDDSAGFRSKTPRPGRKRLQRGKGSFDEAKRKTLAA